MRTVASLGVEEKFYNAYSKEIHQPYRYDIPKYPEVY